MVFWAIFAILFFPSQEGIDLLNFKLTYGQICPVHVNNSHTNPYNSQRSIRSLTQHHLPTYLTTVPLETCVSLGCLWLLLVELIMKLPSDALPLTQGIPWLMLHIYSDVICHLLTTSVVITQPLWFLVPWQIGLAEKLDVCRGSNLVPRAPRFFWSAPWCC